MAREKGVPITLPSRILAEEAGQAALVGGESQIDVLHPGQEVFGNDDTRRLQVELAAAIKRLEQLPFELAEKNKYIAKLMRSLDRSRDRVEDMHNRVVAIRKRFGVEPSQPPIDGKKLSDEG